MVDSRPLDPTGVSAPPEPRTPAGGPPVPGSPRLPGRGALERLYAATNAISASLDDETRLMLRIAEELAILLDARYAGVGILGKDGQLIQFETTGLTPEEEEALRPQPPHGRGILGALLHEGKPLRLDDLTKDPRSVGFPAGHPAMRTFLGVPLVVNEQVIGRLYSTEKRGGDFTDEDEMLALGFAGAAAVAIQSARQTSHLIQSERLRATGELAVGIAHDFNNLLATILGRTEVLLGQVRDAEQRDSLEAIRRAARDGAATVARMREYGRPVDVGEFRPVDLAAVAREAAQLTQPRWQNEAMRTGRTIDVCLDLQPARPVLGDAAALREVLVNLLFNAIDALPTGGDITVGVREIDAGDPTVELAVTDTGVGIPEEMRARIFEPFFTTKGAQGSGLGLPMVRKVVEGHQGTVELISAPGRGTTFRLRFPAAPPGAGEDAPAAPAAEVGEEAVPPATVVLVDDQQDVLDTIGMLLRRDGHDVHAFHDPRAAVDAIEASRPDVVITDLGMPGLSGWEVARLAHDRWPSLPVVLLTGWGRSISPAQLREHGMQAALAKPAELPAIRKVLAQVLQVSAPAPLRILLVDDAAAFATVLGILLTQAGHEVHRVERAQAGIDVLRGADPVDLLILDLNLPDRPSIEVFAAARARAHPPAVCVVSGSDPGAMRGSIPGADLYVEKAQVPDQLAHIFDVARRRAAPEARP